MTTLKIEHSKTLENMIRVTTETTGRTAQTVLLPKDLLYMLLLDKQQIFNCEMRPFRRATKILKEKSHADSTSV